MRRFLFGVLVVFAMQCFVAWIRAGASPPLMSVTDARFRHRYE